MAAELVSTFGQPKDVRVPSHNSATNTDINSWLLNVDLLLNKLLLRGMPDADFSRAPLLASNSPEHSAQDPVQVALQCFGKSILSRGTIRLLKADR